MLVIENVTRIIIEVGIGVVGAIMKTEWMKEMS